MEHLSAEDLAGLLEQLSLDTSAEAGRARQAIRDGTYGKCAVCTDEIAVAALKARPTLGLCPDCREELRQSADGRRLSS